MFIQRIQRVQLGFVVCLMAMMFCETSFASQSDDVTLTVAAGKQAVKPDIASINEDVKFNFVPKFTDKNGKHIEETPSNVKSVSYTLTSDAEKIKSCTPSMTISADKKSASGATTILQDVSATVRYSVEGDHTLTLDVMVTFQDESTLSGSYTITVKVYKATFTIYAKEPDKVVIRAGTGMSGIVTCYVVSKGKKSKKQDQVGHSFWEGKLKNYDSYLTNEQKNINGHQFGLYPKDGDVGISIVNRNPLQLDVRTVAGKIKEDDGHAATAQKAYSGITAEKAKALFAKTILLKNDPQLKYHLTEGIDFDGNVIQNHAHNCTGQAIEMGQLAGCSVPNGEGLVGLVFSINDTASRVKPQIFANPYHLSKQLQQ